MDYHSKKDEDTWPGLLRLSPFPALVVISIPLSKVGSFRHEYILLWSNLPKLINPFSSFPIFTFLSQPLACTAFLLVFLDDPWAPFRTKLSAASCSLSMVPSGIVVFINIRWEKKLLWWGLREALECRKQFHIVLFSLRRIGCSPLEPWILGPISFIFFSTIKSSLSLLLFLFCLFSQYDRVLVRGHLFKKTFVCSYHLRDSKS